MPRAGHNDPAVATVRDRKSTRLNSSHVRISYAVFCLKKKKKSRTSECFSPAIRTPRSHVPHPSHSLTLQITPLPSAHAYFVLPVPLSPSQSYAHSTRP